MVSRLICTVLTPTRTCVLNSGRQLQLFKACSNHLSTSSKQILCSKKDEAPGKGGGSKQNDNDLAEKTRKMLDDTVASMEKVIKDLDKSFGSKLKDAEKSLGTEGFFARLKEKVEKELSRSHQTIGKSAEAVQRDVLHMATLAEKLDFNKMKAAMNKLDPKKLPSSLEGFHLLNWAGKAVTIQVGDIPKEVLDAGEGDKSGKHFVLDLSYPLAGFEPDEIVIKKHGHFIEVQAKKKGQDFVRDAVMEFSLPSEIDENSMKAYYCKRTQRIFVYGDLVKTSSGPRDGPGKDDDSWRTPKDPMF